MIFLQSLEDVPTWFSTYFGISLEAGQAILSVAVILMVLIPVMLANRNRKGFVVEILFFFLTEVILVGIEWLNVWVLVGTVGMMAIAISTLGTNMITGR